MKARLPESASFGCKIFFCFQNNQFNAKYVRAEFDDQNEQNVELA